MQRSPSRSPIRVIAIALLMLPARPALAAEASPAEQITAFRLKHGEVRVIRDATLDRIAADQAREMAAKDNLSHEVLGSFTRRIAPSQAGRAAENIAYGYDNFEKTLGQWINSPEHRKNLLLHNATKVGIASAKTANGKRTYWAMEIAGDYETKPKEKGKKAKPAVVAQAKPDAKPDTNKPDTNTAAKPETHWGAKLPSKPAEKDCHVNIKLIGLCI
ncbi:CAP domain-containing protein [Bradyrhizobium sp. STM 3557]|uniref:CAP domain-containing protein n=1 Tax=Bradyrhizobium sp. STM 3557 TaxID=578920 RepID=UPI00388E7582